MKKKLLVTLTMLLGFSLLPITNAYAVRTTYTTKRLAGNTRFETAVEISKEFVAKTWRPVDSVVLCTAYDYADSVCVTPFATYINAPILLTGRTNLNSATKDRIVAMAVKKVYIIGGIGAISDNVFSQLTSMGLQVERIAGVNRFATNKAIIDKIPASNLGGNVKIIKGYDPYLGFSLALDTIDNNSTTNNIIVNPIIIYNASNLNEDDTTGISAYNDAMYYIDAKYYIDGEWKGYFLYTDTHRDGDPLYLHPGTYNTYTDNSGFNNILGTLQNNETGSFPDNYMNSPFTQNSVIITTTNDYADVMCSGPLSAITYTPIVYLSPTSDIDNNYVANTKSFIDLYKDTSNVYYIGGKSVVKDGIENILNGEMVNY